MKLIVIQLSQSRGSQPGVEITSFHLCVYEIANIQKSNKFISGGRGNYDPQAVPDHGTVTLWSPTSPSQIEMQQFTLFIPLFVPWIAGCKSVLPSHLIWSQLFTAAVKDQHLLMSLSCRTSQITPKQQKHQLSQYFLEELRTSKDLGILLSHLDFCSENSICCLLKVFLHNYFMDSWVLVQFCCFTN